MLMALIVSRFYGDWRKISSCAGRRSGEEQRPAAMIESAPSFTCFFFRRTAIELIDCRGRQYSIDGRFFLRNRCINPPPFSLGWCFFFQVPRILLCFKKNKSNKSTVFDKYNLYHLWGRPERVFFLRKGGRGVVGGYKIIFHQKKRPEKS